MAKTEKSREEIFDLRMASPLLTEEDRVKILALPTFEERDEFSRELYKQRKGESGETPAKKKRGTGKALSEDFSEELRSVIKTEKEDKENLLPRIQILYPKIMGAYNYADNHKIEDYTRFCPAATVILVRAGLYQHKWQDKADVLTKAAEERDVEEIYKHLFFEELGSVVSIRTTEKANGQTLGFDRFRGKWYKCGHTYSTNDTVGINEIEISDADFDQAIKEIGLGQYLTDDQIIRVYGEFYGPSVQSGGGYADEPRWALFDIRIGENFPVWDDFTGWVNYQYIADLKQSLNAMGYNKVDVVTDFGPMSYKEALYNLKNGGYKSRFMWKNGVNLAEQPDQDPITAEGYVLTFQTGENSFSRLKARMDYF